MGSSYQANTPADRERYDEYAAKMQPAGQQPASPYQNNAVPQKDGSANPPQKDGSANAPVKRYGTGSSQFAQGGNFPNDPPAAAKKNGPPGQKPAFKGGNNKAGN